MNRTQVGLLIAMGCCVLVVLQVSLLQSPWRSYLLGFELVAVIIAVSRLHLRVKSLELEVEEHRHRLDAIHQVANRAAVVNEARRVVEHALTLSLQEQEDDMLDA